jgi:chromosome segregation ATPase
MQQQQQEQEHEHEYEQLAVDGFRVVQQASSTSLRANVEDGDLKRRLARREKDLAKKDEDIGVLQRQLKHCKHENESLKLRNTELVDSLALARQQIESLKQLTEGSAALQREQRLMEAEKECQSLGEAVQAKLDEVDDSKAQGVQLENASTELAQNSKRESAVAKTQPGAEKELNNQREQERAEGSTHEDECALIRSQLSRERAEHVRTKALLRDAKEQIAQSASHNGALEQQVQAIAERNEALREQVESVRLDCVSSSMRALHTLESERNALQGRNKDLARSLELHVELLVRSDKEVIDLKAKLAEVSDRTVRLEADLSAASKQRHEARKASKALLHEVVSLRRHNTIVCEAVQTKNSKSKVRDSVPSGSKCVGDTWNGPKKPKQREELRVLRSRVSFLMQQLEHYAILGKEWQQRKLLLRAQLQGMTEAYAELKQRIMKAQAEVSEASYSKRMESIVSTMNSCQDGHDKVALEDQASALARAISNAGNPRQCRKHFARTLWNRRTLRRRARRACSNVTTDR